MRVRISYSVDLDEVPSECARMLEETLQHLNEVHQEIETLVDQLSDKRAIAWQVKGKLDRSRQQLAKIDNVLADNEMILQGYFTALEPQEPEEVSDVSEG